MLNRDIAMATWTILDEATLRRRPIIDGAVPLYGGLDLTATPAPDVSGIAVEFLAPSPEARRWLPDIVAGFNEALLLRRRGVQRLNLASPVPSRVESRMPTEDGAGIRANRSSFVRSCDDGTRPGVA